MTKKLNLQFYYIPVTDVLPMLRSPDSPCQNDGRLSLASYLGRVDPWYNSTVNGLGAAIPKLAEPVTIDLNNLHPCWDLCEAAFRQC